jgi:hypothetical protein
MAPSSSGVAALGRAVFLAFCVVAAVFLIYEHTAHVLGVLPYLLLLACPLMHVFMHHGHRGNHAHHDHSRDRTDPQGGAPGDLRTGQDDQKKQSDW